MKAIMRKGTCCQEQQNLEGKQEGAEMHSCQVNEQRRMSKEHFSFWKPIQKDERKQLQHCLEN